MSELVNCINNLSAKDIIKSIAKTANGVPFYLQTSGLGGFCDEYAAVYAALSAPGAYTSAQNTMVCALADAGYWAGLDIFYDLGAAAEADVVINWVNPGTYNLTKVGTITHVANTGVTSNGTTGYYNTNINFGDGGAYNFVQNDAMIGCYIRTNVSETKVEYGVIGTGDIYVIPTSAGSARLRINDDSNLLIANADSRGLWLATRTGLNKNLYRNGASLGNINTASTGVVNADMYLLCWNSSGAPGLYSNRQVSIFFAGKFSTMDAAAITNIIETYMDAKGIGVIP